MLFGNNSLPLLKGKNNVMSHISLVDKSSYLPTIYDSLHYSYPLKEEVNYFQTTLQFEIELPFDIQFTGQFFTYDTLDYKSDSLPLDEDISIPNLEITVDELNPENIFTPGYGSSIGILTKKAAVISLQKSILDDQLTFKLSSLLDIDNNSHDNSIPGIILSLETSYRLNNNLIIDIGYTKITGDSNHPLGEDYRLIDNPHPEDDYYLLLSLYIQCQ